MKMIIKSSTIVLTVLFASLAYSEEGEGPKNRFGPGKAVIEAQEASGIKLSEKATRNLELQFASVTQNGSVAIPPAALIKFQDFFAIYRKRDGWFKMLEIEPRSANGKVIITSKELKAGDEVVVTNADLLRVVDLDVWGPEADACVD